MRHLRKLLCQLTPALSPAWRLLRPPVESVVDALCAALLIGFLFGGLVHLCYTVPYPDTPEYLLATGLTPDKRGPFSLGAGVLGAALGVWLSRYWWVQARESLHLLAWTVCAGSLVGTCGFGAWYLLGWEPRMGASLGVVLAIMAGLFRLFDSKPLPGQVASKALVGAVAGGALGWLLLGGVASHGAAWWRGIEVPDVRQLGRLVAGILGASWGWLIVAVNLLEKEQGRDLPAHAVPDRGRERREAFLRAVSDGAGRGVLAVLRWSGWKRLDRLPLPVRYAARAFGPYLPLVVVYPCQCRKLDLGPAALSGPAALWIFLLPVVLYAVTFLPHLLVYGRLLPGRLQPGFTRLLFRPNLQEKLQEIQMGFCLIPLLVLGSLRGPEVAAFCHRFFLCLGGIMIAIALAHFGSVFLLVGLGGRTPSWSRLMVYLPVTYAVLLGILLVGHWQLLALPAVAGHLAWHALALRRAGAWEVFRATSGSTAAPAGPGAGSRAFGPAPGLAEDAEDYVRHTAALRSLHLPPGLRDWLLEGERSRFARAASGRAPGKLLEETCVSPS